MTRKKVILKRSLFFSEKRERSRGRHCHRPPVRHVRSQDHQPPRPLAQARTIRGGVPLQRRRGSLVNSDPEDVNSFDGFVVVSLFLNVINFRFVLERRFNYYKNSWTDDWFGGKGLRVVWELNLGFDIWREIDIEGHCWKNRAFVWDSRARYNF